MRDMKKKAVLTGTATLLLSTVLVKIIGAFFKIPLARLLGTLGFGYFSSAYDFFLPVYTLSMSGFPVALAKLISQKNSSGKKEEVGEIFFSARRFLTVFGAVCSVVMLLLSPLVSKLISSDESWLSLVAIAPAFFFSGIISSYRGCFEGNNDMLPTAVSDLISALSKLILGYVFAVAAVLLFKNSAFGAAAAIFGITLGTAFSALYLKLRFKKEKIDLKKSKRYDFRFFFKLTLPFMLSALSVNAVNFVDALFLKNSLGYFFQNNIDKAIEIYPFLNTLGVEIGDLPSFFYGVRSEAYTLFNLIPTLSTAVYVSSVPKLSEEFAKADGNRFSLRCENVLKTVNLIVLPVGIGMSFVAKPIMMLLYDSIEAANIGGNLLSVLGVSAVFAGISIVLCGILQSQNRAKVAAFNIVIGVAIKVLITVFFTLIPEININASSLGTLFCFMYICVANFLLIRKSGINIRLEKVFFKPAVAALLCGVSAKIICGFSQNSLLTLLSIASAGMIYVLLLFVTRAVTSKEISEIIGKVV